MNKHIKTIRRAANVGFYGSLLLVGLAVVAHFTRPMWKFDIVANEYTHKLFLAVALVLAVGDVAVVLFTLRRSLPQVRQLDAVDDRLSRYSGIVRGVYLGTLVVVLVVAAVIVLLNENTLIMLLLLMVLLLMLNYPNMYKIKADLGLLDDEMTQLFGDAYKR